MNTIEIYKICCLNDNITDFYVGSSFCSRARFYGHRNSFKNEKKSKLYDCIKANGGIDNWKYEILERDISKELQRIKEQEYIDKLNPTLNERRAYTTEEIKKEQIKKSREENKEVLAQKKKEYRQNPEVKAKEAEQAKIWRENNKEYHKELRQEWYKNNKEHVAKYANEQYHKNKEAINARRRELYRLKKEQQLLEK
jgi:hypothetical protein